MREIINFNLDWKCKKKGSRKFNLVCLPHSVSTVRHNYFSEKEFQDVYVYLKKIVPTRINRRYILEIEGAMSVSDIYVNDNHIKNHKGGFTSFYVDLTDNLIFNDTNVIKIEVDSTQQEKVPPEGGRIDYLTFGGIYRNVKLHITNNTYLKDPFIKCNMTEKGEAKLSVTADIINSKGNEIIKLLFKDKKGNKFFDNFIQKPILWDVDNPYLYNVEVQLIRNEKLIDKINLKYGIRSIKFSKEDGKFYLNGRHLKLRGLNRHQTYPYLGNAMCDRGQRKDADILKYELGVNFVRTSHYPQSPSFLNRCDEIGLLVFEEIPGWHFIGDREWQDNACYNVKEMIIRDRNHPSIILWGVRINESVDNHDFYLRTNNIAHKYDDTRPTGGVRNIYHSEFLEDVFTYNDFRYIEIGKSLKTWNIPCKVLPANHIPYMVTEYMGHMYPIKSYDCTERHIIHALKHANTLNSIYANPDIAGGCGWCAFDYNTTNEFGSGDNISYHGVMDIFRLPKFAAFFYKSQSNDEPIVFIARRLTPSFNEDYANDVIVFSNCDEVELYAGNKLHSKNRPEYSEFNSLPHPPFVFRNCNWWEWGSQSIKTLKAIGYKSGKKVCEHIRYKVGLPVKLELISDDKVLQADGADCTRVIIRLLDKNNQICHLASFPVSFKIYGGYLIGENPFVLESGTGAVYVKAGRKAETIKLIAKCYTYESELLIKVNSVFIEGSI